MMIQIKKLTRPSKRSGKQLKEGEVSELRKLGIRIINIDGGDNWYVDRVSPKRKRK